MLTLLPFLIFGVLMLLKHKQDSKLNAPVSLFRKIHSIVFILSLLLSSYPIAMFNMITPLAAWPVFTCWTKSSNQFIWKMASGMVLMIALMVPKFLIMYLDIDHYGVLLVFQIGLMLILLAPLTIASVIDAWNQRNKVSTQSVVIQPDQDH